MGVKKEGRGRPHAQCNTDCAVFRITIVHMVPKMHIFRRSYINLINELITEMNLTWIMTAGRLSEWVELNS